MRARIRRRAPSSRTGRPRLATTIVGNGSGARASARSPSDPSESRAPRRHSARHQQRSARAPLGRRRPVRHRAAAEAVRGQHRRPAHRRHRRVERRHPVGAHRRLPVTLLHALAIAARPLPVALPMLGPRVYRPGTATPDRFTRALYPLGPASTGMCGLQCTARTKRSTTSPCVFET